MRFLLFIPFELQYSPQLKRGGEEIFYCIWMIPDPCPLCVELQQFAMIKIDHLVNSYNHIRASDDICCCFPEGKITVILGGSGSGKSTLLKQVVGLEKPDSGSITFRDREIMRKDGFKGLMSRIDEKLRKIEES